MKQKPNFSLDSAASALLVTLFLVTILAVSIGGYMAYVQQQSLLGTRSQKWNVALSISEAGIEEGLEALNSGAMSAPDWSASGSSHVCHRTLPQGEYYVTNDLTDPDAPVITARGYVNLGSLARNTQGPFLAVIGIGGQTSPVTRGVRVKTSRGSLFLAAMVSRHKIDMNGNNVETDSYDSSDPAKSTNSRYDPLKAGDRGDVASNDGVVDALSIGNANIYGHAYTGPGGTASVGTQGAVGTHAWQAGNSGAEPGYVLDNANFTFPDTSLPYTTSGMALIPGPFEIPSILSTSTNSTTYDRVASLPPNPLGVNQSVGPVTTNVTFVSSSIYPGPQSNMTTNATWTTSTTHPGNVAGLVTNCIGFTSQGTSPGAQMCLSTNSLGITNTSSYPGPVSGLVTNFTVVTAGTNITVVTTTNTTTVTTTNCNSGNMTTTTYPASWCWPGGMTTNFTGSGTIKSYNYHTIASFIYTTNKSYTYATNISYTYATNASSYTYPAYNYTYANQFSYTYTQYTYNWQTLTYSYVIYEGVITYTTNRYDHVLSTGDWYDPSLFSGKTLVTGTARLVLPNGLNMSSGDEITIATGASLKIYADGTGITIGGNGVVNKGGFAGDFIVYGTPRVTSFTLNGNGEFTGVLVAPNANVTMNGGGHLDNDFSGTLMVNSVTMNGHFKFHYDEALSRMGGNGRFLIKSWDELP